MEKFLHISRIASVHSNFSKVKIVFSDCFVLIPAPMYSFLFMAFLCGCPNKEFTCRHQSYFGPVGKQAVMPNAGWLYSRWLLWSPSLCRSRAMSFLLILIWRRYSIRSISLNRWKQFLRWSRCEGWARKNWNGMRWTVNCFNVKLFRFATSFKKPKYGVLFWAVTIIDCPEEMKDVRLSVGSNGASMWWLNGEEAVMLEGDRRMVLRWWFPRNLPWRKVGIFFVVQSSMVLVWATSLSDSSTDRASLSETCLFTWSSAINKESYETEQYIFQIF